MPDKKATTALKAVINSTENPQFRSAAEATLEKNLQDMSEVAPAGGFNLESAQHRSAERIILTVDPDYHTSAKSGNTNPRNAALEQYAKNVSEATLVFFKTTLPPPTATNDAAYEGPSHAVNVDEIIAKRK